MPKTTKFNKVIREWRNQITDLNTWTDYRMFFHQDHHEQKRAVIIAGKGGYTVAVQYIYGVLPYSPEEHHKAIDHLNIIVKEMQTQSYDLEGLAQAN